MKRLIVLLASVALVLSFAVTAAANDWSFYGSARMTTFWNDQDANWGDDDETTWAMQGNSRIGANVKGDAVNGRFEFSNAVGTRLLYGTWNFGGGTLLVGQTYGPVNIFTSNQVYGGDADLLNVGGTYGGRTPMLQVSFGPAKIALLSPQGATSVGATGGDGDNVIPKLEASVDYKSDLFWVTLQGGYQTYEIENSTIGGYDVDAYVLSVGGGFNFGPAAIKLQALYGQNTSSYGLWHVQGVGVPSVSGTNIVDSDTLGFTGVVTFKATDMFTLEGGYGYIQIDSGITGQTENDAQGYYVQAVISPAPGVYIIPEVGVVDLMDSAGGADEGQTTYLGAKWQINF